MSASIETFRAEAAAFLASSIEDGSACPAFGAILPPAFHDRARIWQRRMFEAGFAGIHWPTEYGGGGYDQTYSAAWSEECAKARVSPYLNLQGLVLAGGAILRSGTSAQKERYLSATLSGETLWCQLFSEPEAGSDLAGLATRAVRDGDTWVVNGQKVWCSNGQHAESGILMARTGSAEQGHRGISFFLVDMDTPGIEVRTLRQMTGDEEFCEVFFDEVRIPATALLGEENAGWGISMAVLQDERGSSGSSGLISLERRLESLSRLQGDSPVQRDHLMRLLVRGHALKAMLMRSGEGPAQSAAAKLLRTELEFDAEALELALGGSQSMVHGPQTDRFLYSPGMRIAGGTSEIQRNIIAERILGLPRGPR